MIDVLLNNKCGKYLTYRDFIECGETQEKLAIPNAPIQKETINALYELSINILDPVIEKFGDIHLTYGLCTHELGKKIKQRVAPKLDQHASNELNKKGQPICTRLGAAVDFIIPDMNMRVVANWIATRTPFDRLYFYGDDRPIHVSYGPV